MFSLENPPIHFLWVAGELRLVANFLLLLIRRTRPWVLPGHKLDQHQLVRLGEAVCLETPKERR